MTAVHVYCLSIVHIKVLLHDWPDRSPMRPQQPIQAGTTSQYNLPVQPLSTTAQYNLSVQPLNTTSQYNLLTNDQIDDNIL